MERQLLDKMIERGVRRIRDLGYPTVNIYNIFTDCVFSDMFRMILKDSFGKGYDDEIKELLARIEHDHKD